MSTRGGEGTGFGDPSYGEAGRASSGGGAGDDDVADKVADGVDDTVDEHPWLERLASFGWMAKGVVYVLMGLAAISIARQDETGEEASPQGSLKQISESPWGRFLLPVLAAGLFLYALWRFLSVALIREHGLQEWADRIGFAFSGAFYTVLGWSATKAVLNGSEEGSSNTVERLSKALLETQPGRWLLGIGGAVTMAVGLYFGIRKGIMRSFAEDLDGVHERPSANEPKRRALLVAGIAGWIGRGIVTGLVGFFIARAISTRRCRP